MTPAASHDPLNTRRRCAGFTLIELLVAMFITAMVFTIGYGAIMQAVNNREVVAAKQARLLDVQRTMRLLAQDFTQLAPRPVRQQNAYWDPALLADRRGTTLFALTRGGWPNPVGVPRASQQRVRYVLEEKILYREYFPVLDATLGQKSRRRRLLDQVTSVQLRYMDDNRVWQQSWPPQTQNNPPNQLDLRVRPLAVEITIDTEDWGKLVRLVEVAS